jgi:hypothetical protein
LVSYKILASDFYGYCLIADETKVVRLLVPINGESALISLYGNYVSTGKATGEASGKAQEILRIITCLESILVMCFD